MCTVKLIKNAAKIIKITLYDGTSKIIRYSENEISDYGLYTQERIKQYTVESQKLNGNNVIDLKIMVDRNPDTYYISEHAMKRLKERSGWPKSAYVRMIQRVIEQGKSPRTSMLYSFADNYWYRVYGEFFYVFSSDELVTMYHVSNSVLAMCA
jgi:hypothetical protein